MSLITRSMNLRTPVISGSTIISSSTNAIRYIMPMLVSVRPSVLRPCMNPPSDTPPSAFAVPAALTAPAVSYAMGC